MRRLREVVVDRAVNGRGMVPSDRRRAAFDDPGADPRTGPLLKKVARHAWKVTREDIAALETAGVPDDEIFELVVCAALGQATRQIRFALAALDEATGAGASFHPPAGRQGGGR